MKEHNRMMTGKFKVENQHLAIEIGSGTVPFLGTTAIIGFMENIASNLAQKDLPPDRTSVGIYIEMEHLKPTRPGQMVCIEAQIVEYEEKVITFSIQAYEKDLLIGKAIHRRAVVDRKKIRGPLVF